jgi:hypothetical protein
VVDDNLIGTDGSQNGCTRRRVLCLFDACPRPVIPIRQTRLVSDRLRERVHLESPGPNRLNHVAGKKALDEVAGSSAPSEFIGEREAALRVARTHP